MNEITTVNENTNVLPGVIQKDGKFKRQAQYNQISTIKAETKEEQFKIASILIDGEGVTQFKDAVGTQFELVDVITSPYESVDELTGELTPGVTTTLFASDGNVYVTSSKSTYFKLMQLFEIFGLPGQAPFNIKLEIVAEQSNYSKNKIMNVKLVK